MTDEKDWNFKPIVNPIHSTKGRYKAPIVKALDTQVGGDHYKSMAIQPTLYCQMNRLNACESNIVKYASRHKAKGGAADVRKIIHYAQLLLQLEYPEEN